MPPIARQSTQQSAPLTVEHPPADYGQFTPDGREFVILNPRTPRPWVNIIANPRIGLAVSNTGSGFTWIDNSQLAVLTRWQQEFATDASGKFLYVRDAATGAVWSLSPAPTWAAAASYTCRHGLGYTVFSSRFAGIRADWTLFAHESEPIELWHVTFQNESGRARRLEICAYLEWNCGVSPAPRREFHKLFLETEYFAKRRAVIARALMWDVPRRERGHWNADFPYTSVFACSEPILSAQGDKGAFLGRFGDLRAPAALNEDVWRPEFGRHADAIAALRSAIDLPPGAEHAVGYALAANESRDAALNLVQVWVHPDGMPAALDDVRRSWTARLAGHRVRLPEPTLNHLVNDWVRYQAISARIWGRAGYYQQSGAYGFRDQLQDSQVWLTIDPPKCREQIDLHARHQFADGSVYHWWHPLSEQGHVTRMSDDLLWLAFVTASYIRETGDLGVLRDAAPYLDEPTPRPLADHVMRAFRRVLSRMSPRGLPYIGAGDWNDGLSAMGLAERGESVWLGHFLAGLLADWAEIARREQARGSGAPQGEAWWRGCADDFERRRAALVAAINEHAWDGAWYIRGTLDSGEKLGSRDNRVGRIFLNAQTWAILNDVAPPDRAAECWRAVREHLLTDAGALLLAPAFDQPREDIGYITRYAPGLRENGGVYTHAATWAIAAAAKMRDAEAVGRLLTAINPATKDSERYWAEPYVLPGNVDGPDSPHFGRAGWTWYTGSAQWLHRVVCERVLGVRPEWDGLRIDPCLPPSWPRATMVRPWRGGTVHVEIESRASGAGGRAEVTVDGRPAAGGLVGPVAPGSVVNVRALV